MLETEYFFGDTLEMGKWIKVEKILKHYAILKYITLGIFKNESFLYCTEGSLMML
ncbi:MAG: hypothetical protein IPJ43_10395 [Saprospiraceae bacterium]|nr:hypothetical protein [Saprospiraceae bacterium]